MLRWDKPSKKQSNPKQANQNKTKHNSLFLSGAVRKTIMNFEEVALVIYKNIYFKDET